MSETVLPVAETPEASETEVKPVEAQTASADPNATPAETEAKEEKPPKSAEQREIERLRRRMDARTRRLYETEARLKDLESRLISDQPAAHNQAGASDGDALTLSRAELQKLIDAEAKRIAPTITEQQAGIERRQSVIESLADTWGQERFDEIAADLDAAFGGLKDRGGQIKPATEALFESDHPQDLIEYLADPEHAAEARALARLGPVQAGRAIAQLESKLLAAKAKPKAEPSKIPAPIEPVRAQGRVEKDASEMTDAEFAAWRRKQISQRS